MYTTCGPQGSQYRGFVLVHGDLDSQDRLLEDLRLSNLRRWKIYFIFRNKAKEMRGNLIVGVRTEMSLVENNK